MLHYNRISASFRFRNNGPQTHWGNRGNDLDISGSRDVIDHVTIRFAVFRFLLVVHWNRTSISNRF